MRHSQIMASSKGMGSMLAGILLIVFPGAALGKETVDLKKACVVSGPSARELNAARMLVDEAAVRSRIRWPLMKEKPASTAGPVIVVGLHDQVVKTLSAQQREQLKTPEKRPAEGFTLQVLPGSPATVVVLGNDDRGVLFGVGKLLREIEFGRDTATLEAALSMSSSPKTPLRGHQLGFRPKTNSYDAWTIEMWEQYVRDLAAFGCNAVELIPPRSDDDDDSPHFPLPPMEMMVEMSALLDRYDMDVWVWYPAMDKDYGDPNTVQFALKEWDAVLKKLPRIDAIFVPSGDPGHTRPRHLMDLLAKQTEQLKRHHPDAEMWISLQSFTSTWMDEVLEIINKEQPDWLAGIVYGPQIRIPLPKLKTLIPSKYPIRRYPDITHSIRCQYPVANWDIAYVRTEGREVINPRPIDENAIYQTFKDDTIGFITYSEGCNDDVNKIVWSGLGWDPSTPVAEILRDYGDYFIGEELGESFATGLLALERNWAGPLISNSSVKTTLQQFQDMERKATPATLLNWRFQQALYRAYYDAFVYERLVSETMLEQQATNELAKADRVGSLKAIDRAEELLAKTIHHPAGAELRARVFELAEALFQSIRMQLSVPRYQAIDIGRGANLDAIDFPINDRAWLTSQFDKIRKMGSEHERREAIQEIVTWTDPGPGGYYDDLGDERNQPHLVPGLPYAKDPGFRYSPVVGFDYESDWKLSWCRYVDGLYDVPVQMHYTGLDPTANYKIRVIYTPDNLEAEVRLVTDDGAEIHPFLKKPLPPRKLVFDIPAASTSDGELTLTWTASPERGGAGRGPQVAEVWLIRQP